MARGRSSVAESERLDLPSGVAGRMTERDTIVVGCEIRGGVAGFQPRRLLSFVSLVLGLLLSDCGQSQGNQALVTLEDGWETVLPGDVGIEQGQIEAAMRDIRNGG
jgi:hypothetical protein